MNVPFLDIAAQNRSLETELQAAMGSVIADAQFILGPAVARFEANFARYLGVRHCIGLNNGTSALHLAMLACNIGPGDEVITTPYTWISTSWAISYLEAKPVYVDIDPDSYNLDPELVAAAITPRTKAILPVHLCGRAAEASRLRQIADAHGLLLIEDAAQAHGAIHEGRRVGTFGQAACFSFYPGKNLGAFGEGGAVVTDDDALAERIRNLRDHAQRGRHQHVEIGFNARMEGLQGAVLDVKLRHLDAWNAARARHAGRYRELLASAPGLTLPQPGPAGAHVWHLFVVLTGHGQRDAFREALTAAGVGSGVHYPTLVPFQPAYRELGYQPGDFPVAEDVVARCVSLPMFAELTDEQIKFTCDAAREFLSGVRAEAQVAK